MTSSSPDAMFELCRHFIAALPWKLHELGEAAKALDRSGWQRGELEPVRLLAHGLGVSAEAFGFHAVSSAARALESQLEQSSASDGPLEAQARQAIGRNLTQLERAVQTWLDERTSVPTGADAARAQADIQPRTPPVPREVLLAQQGFAQSVLDSMPANIAVLDSDGVIIAVNAPWRRFGAEKLREQSSGREQPDIGVDYLAFCRQATGKSDEFPSAAGEGIEAVIAGAMDEFRLEYPCHACGAQRWFEMRVTRLVGGVAGVVVSHIDITQRKLAEASAEQARQRFRLGQRFANIGTWDWNIVSGELYWSERIAPLFGYPEGGLETSYENFLGAVHPEDRPAVVDAVNAAVERDDPYEIEHRVVWPDGSVHWLLERGAVERDPDGKPIRMLGVVQDIDNRKRVE